MGAGPRHRQDRRARRDPHPPSRAASRGTCTPQDPPRLGYDIIAGIAFPWPIAQMVLQHHERLDGTGYPNGLHGDQILLGARIIAVADTVEAMATHRPYRSGRGLDAALAEIRTGRGRRYAPDVVDACLRLAEQDRLPLDQPPETA